MKWHPLIVGNKKSAFKKKISQIAGTLSANIHCFKDNNGIVVDRLGVVLFLFYYSRFSGEDKYADYGLDLLSTVLDEVNRDLENGAHEYSANRLAGVGARYARYRPMENVPGQGKPGVDGFRMQTSSMGSAVLALH